MDRRVHDDAQVMALGHEPKLRRNFSFISLLGLAFAILDSWQALSVSMSLALPSGGPSSVIWGLLTAGIGNVALAMSMGEFLSAYPTAGGQYHWVAIISPPRYKRFLSWITGWINMGGWIALAATSGVLASELIVGLVALFKPAYEPKQWHQFLVYIGYSIAGYVMNVFGTSSLPHMNKWGFYATLVGFVATVITMLATADVGYADAGWVFGKFINQTGWPDGVAWILGLIQGSFGLCAYDAVAHMIEEVPHASVQGPRIMVASVYTGLGTGLVFLIVMLFVSGGEKYVDQVINSAETPLVKIFHLSTSSRAGTTVLTMISLFCMIFATLGGFTASSRMTYAFAREKGVPFWWVFSRVNGRLGMPLHALSMTMAWVLVFGFIYLASTTAFDAITSTAVIALNLTYGIPIIINCLQGRRKIPECPYQLGPLLGWTVNLIGIVYVLVTTVFFFFPEELPVTPSNMNYCIVVFAIIMLLCLGYWGIRGHREYEGPIVHFATDEPEYADDPALAEADHTEVTLDGKTARGLGKDPD